MPFTILIPNTYSLRPKQTASLYLVYPGIRFLFCLETPSVSLSGNRFITGVGYPLRIVTLLSVLLLNAFFVFVDIVIHCIIDLRLSYFIFVGKDKLIFISDFNRIKYPSLVFVIGIIVFVAFNRFPGIIYVIISYIVFIIFTKF